MSVYDPSKPSPLQGIALQQTLDAQLGEVAAADVQVSQRIGRYVLLKQLGEGGMGIVFAAYDDQLDRKVALKLLHEAKTGPSDQRQRMLREAQAMARVSHPNVVHVYDVGELNDRIFISMEYIDGMTLTAWQEQPRNWTEILDMYRQAGQGLLAAHGNGLVHRDFKPDNVLIDKENHVRVADFGLARLQDSAPPIEAAPVLSDAEHPLTGAALTRPGAISGTPGFMSPEQYHGAAIDGLSDQFSFCVALYDALFGRLPFAGDSLAEQAREVLAGRVRPPPEVSDVPRSIRQALLRGLSLDPQQRFPSMTELLAALELEVKSDPTAAHDARRRFSVLILGVATLLTMLIGFRSWHGGLTVRSLFAFAVIGNLVVFVFAMAFRRSLFVHSFHRSISVIVLIGLSTWTAIRGLCLQLQIDVLKLIPIDLMLLGGFHAIIAYQYLVRLWWLVGFLIAGSLLAALRPQNAEQVAVLAYTIWPLLLVYSWESAADRRTARKIFRSQPTDSQRNKRASGRHLRSPARRS